MKMAFITDTHWGARNDNLSFLDYFEKFYNEEFFPEIKRLGITTIVHLGDLVDRRKYINYVTLRRMRTVFFERCRTEGIDLHVIVGNHDVTYKNTNDINSMNELFQDSGVKYYVNAEEAEFDGHKVLMVPWINNSNREDTLKLMAETKAEVLFGHLEVAGCFMDRGMINDHGQSVKDFSRFDRVFTGHFHHKSRTGNIDYLGAPYEITWTDYQDPKGWHVYDTDTREIEFKRNPYSMFHKIFYNDSNKTIDDITEKNFDMYRGTYVKVVKQNCENPYWFDMFIDKLYKADPNHIQIVDDHLNLGLQDDEDIVNEAEDTVTILSKYVSSMSDKVPKKRLDKLLRTLYNEAMQMDVG